MYEKLYSYQKAAVEFVLKLDGAALFFQQGTGKTWITGGVLERMDDLTDALIVVPLANLETTWLKLLRTELPHLSVATDWESFKKLPTPRVLLVNYEGLPDRKRKGKTKRGIIHRVRKHPWSIVVYDESQRLKDRGSRASRDAKRLRYAARRLILSGTPVEQCPQDLWAQLRFVAPEVLGDRWSDFENKFLRREGYMGHQRVFKRHRMKAFLERIKNVCLRVTKEEVLDLPPLTVKTYPVTLRGDQGRMYRELEDDMVLDLGDGSQVTTELRITQMVKLQQLCGGFIKDDEGHTRRIGRAKLRKALALLNRLPRPVVIFCRNKEEIFWLQEEIPGSEVLMGKTKNRPALIERFQLGGVPVLICQIRTGGVGIDLFHAHHAILFSSTFSFIDFDQAISRLHRIGQVWPVVIHLLFAKATIDEDIALAVRFKQSVSDLILNRLKRRNTMAKDKKAAKKTSKKGAKKGASKKTPDEAPKYGVAELAEALGVTAATCRVKLRNAKIKKNGKSYGWASKSDLDKVVKALIADE